MSDESTTPAWLRWTERAVAIAALAVVTWVLITAGGALVHGHPAYAIMVGATAVVAVTVLVLSLRPGRGRLVVLRVILAAAGLVWVAAIGWLRPFIAVEPALAAMESDGAVTVAESATRIVLTPASPGEVTVLFQPGARVDPRAYAAHLRPLAEAGHTVVIVKQPLGIGFLALGAYAEARAELGGPTWVVAGHSLGGTVASLEAAAAYPEGEPAPEGLLLWASYPAEPMTGYAGAVASVSGSSDGLSTPADIEASRADLPAGAAFTVVEGASHAQFGSYGPQPGDGAPSLTDDQARAAIVPPSLALLDSLAP